jgi:ferric-dicitrate binding protein FerR (iron transport regulator)
VFGDGSKGEEREGKMTTQDGEEPLPVEEAVMWLIRRNDEGAAVDAPFSAWIEAMPRGHEALVAAQKMWVRLDHLDPHHEIDVADLIARAKAARDSKAVPVMPGGEPCFASCLHVRREWRSSGAALDVAAAIVVGWAVCVSCNGVGHGNTIDEQQVEHLTERAMSEAFETRFDLYYRKGGLAVPVVAHPSGNEGSVTLGAGEQLSIDPDGQYREVDQVDVSRALLWRQRQVSFEDLPLAQVADEFNRYSKIKIAVEGDELRARRVRGDFAVDQLETFLEYLQREDPGVIAESVGSEIVLRLR